VNRREIEMKEPRNLLCQQPEAWIVWKCEGEQKVQDRLRQLPSKEVALLHLDYHLLNVLTDGKQITGIVDWTNAHAGDPRALAPARHWTNTWKARAGCQGLTGTARVDLPPPIELKRID